MVGVEEAVSACFLAGVAPDAVTVAVSASAIARVIAGDRNPARSTDKDFDIFGASECVALKNNALGNNCERDESYSATVRSPSTKTSNPVIPNSVRDLLSPRDQKSRASASAIIFRWGLTRCSAAARIELVPEKDRPWQNFASPSFNTSIRLRWSG